MTATYADVGEQSPSAEDLELARLRDLVRDLQAKPTTKRLLEENEALRDEVRRLRTQWDDEIHDANMDREAAKSVVAELAAARAHAKTLLMCLRALLNRSGCAGCIPSDRAPEYVRGKNTRLAADEHEGDCVSLAVIAAIRAAEEAGLG